MSLSQQTNDLQTLSTTKDLTTLTNISELYQDLIDNLTEHNHLYYVQAKPIISDGEYDQLFDFLKRIEEEFPYLISSNSPTQSLIGQIAEWFEKADHTIPLLSLENSYSTEDLTDFDERVQKLLAKNWILNPLYTIEPKYDGISVEIIYQNGKLTKAITRGDGITGEDITTNVQTIQNLPKTLRGEVPEFLSVRWEIMMPKSVRKEINLQREKEGKEMFANTRNATAGSIKLLDSGEVAKRGLVCFVYDILSIGDSERDPQEYDISSFNFPNVDLKKQPTSISEIKKLCLDPATKTQLAQQDFDFDGLVIKLFDKQSRSLLGSTNHHPRRAIAYKFPAEQASTQILSVDFQVGRSGIITPVANLEPVKLSGVEISRVSLHNFDFIKEKEIKKSDFIWIQRSGEVIPYITSVIKNRRNGSEELIEPPLFCPSCQAPIINIDIHYYCTNPNCPAQIKEKILHFASKNAMDIQGLGDTIIETLVNRGLLHNVADLYHLEDPKLRVLLRKFPGFGDRKIYEITKGIKASKEQPFRRLLNALGIPHVGIKTAQDITNFLKGEKADSLMKIQSLLIDPEKMVALPGIGEKIILTLQNFFSNPQTQALLEKLQNYGVNFSAVNAFEENKGALGSFSLTGKFPFPKEQIIEVLEKLWYAFHTTPTKQTSFIFIGEEAGNKSQKAEEYHLLTYRDREEIVQTFPPLGELQLHTKPKPFVHTIRQEGLF